MLYYGYKNAIFDLTELVNKTLESFRKVPRTDSLILYSLAAYIVSYKNLVMVWQWHAHVI